jgi:hypothetical protein
MVKADAEAKHDFESYIQQAATGSSTADQLHKLADLKEKGAISPEEFERAKAKLLD